MIKISNFSTFCFLILSSTVGLAMPTSWYLNPEDQTEVQLQSTTPTSPEEDEGKMQSIMSSTLVGLDDHQEIAPLANNAEKKPWRLAAFISEITISKKGLIGSLTGKGAATVQVYSRKKQAQPLNQDNSQQSLVSESDIPSILFTPYTTVADVEKSFDSMFDRVSKSRKVENKDKLKALFIDEAKKFMVLTSSVSTAGQTMWQPHRIRFDVGWGKSGKFLTGFTSVGADIRLRFEWFNIHCPKCKQDGVPMGLLENDFNRTLSQNFGKFINDLALDLSTIGDAAQTGAFKLKSMRIGVGVTHKMQVGIAKADSSAFAYVYFRKVAIKQPMNEVITDNQSSENILLIEENASPAHIQFAHMNSIQANKDLEKTSYEIPRSKLRAGLEKTLQKNKFILAAAGKSDSKKWEVYKLKTAFSMSLTGESSLPYIGGQISGELDYEKN